MPASSSENNSPWIGKKAPDFNLPDQEGKQQELAAYRGRHVVLYWYPKDDTPGCTKQACGFRDSSGEFQKREVAVLGISILDSASKARFAKKHALDFPLLADEDHAVAESYGVWKEKSRYGRTYMGITRETFLIAPDGTIAAHWPKAAGSEDHARDVLNWLDQHK